MTDALDKQGTEWEWNMYSWGEVGVVIGKKSNRKITQGLINRETNVYDNKLTHKYRHP